VTGGVGLSVIDLCVTFCCSTLYVNSAHDSVSPVKLQILQRSELFSSIYKK